jgi:hypothetical protein
VIVPPDVGVDGTVSFLGWAEGVELAELLPLLGLLVHPAKTSELIRTKTTNTEMNEFFFKMLNLPIFDGHRNGF